MRERLQKIIAQAGIASRRAAERLIEEGRVTVNGQVAALGDQADPETDHIKVKGKLLKAAAEHKEYYLFYKPRGVLTTAAQDTEHPTVFEFFEKNPVRVFPVGRLDLDSEGLIIMTNDGDLANALMHPKGEIPKRYRVKVKGVPGERAIDLLRKGVPLSDGRTAPAQVELVETTKTNAWFDVIIHEGRNRQIRRMFDHVHHSVVKLRRVGYAFLSVGDLKPGTARAITPAEVQRLRTLAQDSAKPKAAAKRVTNAGTPTARAPKPAAKKTPVAKSASAKPTPAKPRAPRATPKPTNTRKGR
ncbi:MAG: pseudouridine synthase [Nitrospirae bacterium]|nr:pseudouridine synthase [Nitrospirota bacterium]